MNFREPNHYLATSYVIRLTETCESNIAQTVPSIVDMGAVWHFRGVK